MNFFVFIGYYLICTLILFLIGFIIVKLILRKHCFDFSKYAEKEIDNYFHAYDDNINDLIKELEEGDKDVDTTDGQTWNG